MGWSTVEDRRVTLDSGKSHGIYVKPLGMVGSMAVAVGECGLCGPSPLFVRRSQEYMFSVAYPGF